MDKYVLKWDYVVPKGTIFERIDGTKREYVEGNFEATISLDMNTTMSITTTPEDYSGNMFERIPDKKLTPQERSMEALGKITKQLEEFMNEYCSPHDILVVEQGTVQLFKGNFSLPMRIPD